MIEEIEDTIQQVTDEITTPVTSAPEKETAEYYDRALDQKNLYDAIVAKLRLLNDNTIKAFNVNPEEGYGLLASMKTLFDACNRRIAILKESDFSDVLETTIGELEEETDMLQENIEDFNAIHDSHPHDQHLQSLLSQL